MEMTVLSFWFHVIFILSCFNARSRIQIKITMKITNSLCIALALTLLAGCESEKGERHESQANLQAQAKISKADAERIALAQAPNGSIKESELEREKGKLIWSFDIATPGSKDITEVNVDAVSGQVIGVEKESPKTEAKEKEKEKDDDKN